MERNSQIGYNELIEFLNMLDSHCKNEPDFFNYNLLDIIGSCFGYTESSLSNYTNNQFKGIICNSYIRDDISRNTEYYISDFQPIDPFAKILCNLPESDKKGNAVRSSHLITNSEQSEIYHKKHLEQNFGLRWSAAILLGDYRIVLHKSKKNPDFTDSEVDSLHYLGNLMYLKFKEYNTKAIITESLQSTHSLLDQIKIGTIIIDDSYNLIDYNNTALSYLLSLTNVSNINDSIKHLMNILDEFCDLQSNNPICKHIKINKFNILLTTNLTKDSFGISHKYFRIEIKKNDSLIELSEKYHLSSREMEVVNLMCCGKTYQEVADTLFISISTVRTHVKNIYRKMDINNQRMLMNIFKDCY